MSLCLSRILLKFSGNSVGQTILGVGYPPFRKDSDYRPSARLPHGAASSLVKRSSSASRLNRGIGLSRTSLGVLPYHGRGMFALPSRRCAAEIGREALKAHRCWHIIKVELLNCHPSIFHDRAARS